MRFILNTFDGNCHWTSQIKCIFNWENMKELVWSRLSSTFAAVPFLFTQSIFFKTFRTEMLSLEFETSISTFGSLALITPVPIAITIFWDITVPAKGYPTITCLIFSYISSSTKFGPFFFFPIKKIFFCNFSFHLFTVVPLRGNFA